MLLNKIKSALGISEYNTAFDEEIGDNILAALADMEYTTDIAYLEQNDSLVYKAITTYCGWQHNLMHGNADLSEKFKRSYNEQKKTLLMSSKYNGG